MATNGMVRKLSNMCYMQQNHCGSTCNVARRWKWDMTHFTTPKNKQDTKYAVLILNRPITQNQDFIQTFWNNAAVRITIDGGTGQWDKFVSALPSDVENSLKPPDLITGDFDSIKEEVMQKYIKKGCKTIHTPNQDRTDFTKALMELNTYCEQFKLELDHVVAVGQTSGRTDHILANIHTLFLVKEKHLLVTQPNCNVYIMSDDSLSWLLYPGDHVITIPVETLKHKKAWCSLVPIGETCQSLSSTGLKWNLDNQQLKFGELVSTSNTFNGSDKVTIKCSHTILWSMRMPSLFG